MIHIGTDELILHARKNGYGAGKSTAELGRLIGKQIQDLGGTIVVKDQPCRWGNMGAFISADDLPKTATQFSLDPADLPALYKFVDTL